ncbi:DUF2264 domain-containing protein [Aquibacillus kalidii]|uniref:DUF2264 domain-containing protein n=1 Tax=Aquibacillus kalidii TaxID=2762597 RepID=UPI0016479968|nr:DUF2264 domain-containing protein [Aquibacillus kalidii]
MKAFDLPIKENKLKTKEDLQLALKQICEPLKSTYSRGRSQFHLGNTSAAYPDEVAQMEGFSRVLWGLAPLLAGGDDYDLWDLHLEGIKNGTNPTHEEYWGDIHDYDQRIVEMAAFGLTLALVPERVWDPLSEREKTNLVNWLKQVDDHPVHDCNWLFFPILVNLGFKTVDVPYNKELIERNLNRIEEFYLSDGWYADGINGHSDYYVPFAIHFYSLIYAKLMENEDPKRAILYKERASLFANDFIYWFAKDGSAVPYGRSMTYRFSQSAFWSAFVFAEVDAFSYGELKGLILSNLRWWFKQPIFDRDGILTIGYRYPNLVMAENYNSPGSPYWGLKTFLILALNDNHPFWDATEQPLPSLNDTSIQQSPNLIFCRQDNKEHVVAFNTGHSETNEHTHTSAKYEKFAYSNYFGFSVPRAEWGLEQGAFDSMLALSEEGDNLFRVKRSCIEQSVANGIVYTKWKPWSDVVVSSWIIPGLPWHVRIHCIDSERYLDSAEGGFAMDVDNHCGKSIDIELVQNDQEALAKASWGISGIKNLLETGTVEMIFPNSNTNVMHSRTTIPTIKSKIVPGRNWLVSAVFGEPGKNASVHWEQAPYIEMEHDNLVVYSKCDQKVLFRMST